MLLKIGKKAQTTAEYAILITLVIGAAMAMQVYVKRGLQGRVRDVVDHTGQGGEVAGQNLQLTGDQFEPDYTSATGTTEQTGKSSEEMKAGGAITRETKESKTVVDREQTIEGTE